MFLPPLREKGQGGGLFEGLIAEFISLPVGADYVPTNRPLPEGGR